MRERMAIEKAIILINFIVVFYEINSRIIAIIITINEKFTALQYVELRESKKNIFYEEENGNRGTDKNKQNKSIKQTCTIKSLSS